MSTFSGYPTIKLLRKGRFLDYTHALTLARRHFHPPTHTRARAHTMTYSITATHLRSRRDWDSSAVSPECQRRLVTVHTRVTFVLSVYCSCHHCSPCISTSRPTRTRATTWNQTVRVQQQQQQQRHNYTHDNNNTKTKQNKNSFIPLMTRQPLTNMLADVSRPLNCY